jgi:uncharacterized membrane protein
MVNIELILSWVLRIGVLASAALMVTGFFLGANLIWFGVLLLMLTPFMRIVIAGSIFLTQKNFLFFAIALYVIFILVIGSILKF